MARTRPGASHPLRACSASACSSPGITSLLKLIAALLISDTQDECEELTALLVARLALQERRHQRYSGRYGRQGPYDQVKSEDFFEIILRYSSTRWFKSWLRSAQDGSDLNDLIQDDPVFVSMGKKPQQPPWYQLVVFLCRLAIFLCRMGNKTGITAASFASISEDMVWLYTDRVCQAFRNICDQHDAEARLWGWDIHSIGEATVHERLCVLVLEEDVCSKRRSTIEGGSHHMTTDGLALFKIVACSARRTFGAIVSGTSGRISISLSTKGIH
ncbi:hypothetical protein C8T65DRAFT_700417 [Cerioporus squamosus]|nr:hypothetical protein C8T65DRAFT_700417 [Cerioporus squamosus]